MQPEKSPSLPDAHQQIRLGDIQASAQKWTAAIEYYLRAIEYFKAIQKTLQDDSLISIIQEQIVQGEKMIQFYHLKDRSEKAMKAECHSKPTRSHSIADMKPSSETNRMTSRRNTVQLENTELLGGRNGMDSFAALIFANNESSTKKPSPILAKKNEKNDSQKLEELKICCEATKTHLNVAVDEIEKLKRENYELRMKWEVNNLQEKIDFGLLSTNYEAKEEPENELEETL